jgi:uncharacterized membrane protein
MNDHLRLIFAPLLPAGLLELLAIAAGMLVIGALLRRAPGALWRAGVFALLLLALADPSLIEEQREPLKDTVLLVSDESASMQLGDRAQQAAKAIEALRKKLAGFSDLDIETLSVKGTQETDLFGAVESRLTGLARDRIAGIIAVTDGEIHDKPQNETSLPGPLHVLLAGHRNEIDRRLEITASPAYGIVGKAVTLSLRLDDHPRAQSQTAAVTFRRDDGASGSFEMPVGQDVKFDVPVGHAGPNLFVFSTAALPGELTSINNSAVVSINGIRDRLRVLLISGEPHIGERTWRNFLKADPAVDLVHFTILRSPSKMDGIPNSELALIAFPVHELFDVKLKSFDLVIFDRFSRQSLVPDNYIENIARYVEQGGALLISNATDEGIPEITFSPLARVLPAEATGHLLTGSFVPDLTEAGQRHPVTNVLTQDMPRSTWGPWFRQIESRARKGDVLMTGINGAPLLVLDRVGQGRVAQFLSDQFWLWTRGYAGGGPQAELLRRTAHWLVDEPELDETALRAHAEIEENGWQLVITKQSLQDTSAVVSVTDPDDQTTQTTLGPGKQPGVLQAVQPIIKTGLYRIKENGGAGQEILVMAGPVNAPEFADMYATDEKLKPYTKASGGGTVWLEDAPDGPDIRRTSAGGGQSGWNWIGLKKNEQYRITGSLAWPLWPAWLAVIVLLGTAMIAWRREGRA